MLTSAVDRTNVQYINSCKSIKNIYWKDNFISYVIFSLQNTLGVMFENDWCYYGMIPNFHLLKQVYICALKILVEFFILSKNEVYFVIYGI